MGKREWEVGQGRWRKKLKEERGEKLDEEKVKMEGENK